MTCNFILMVLLFTGNGEVLEKSLVGQFAVTLDENIVYLDNRGNWTTIDSFVSKSQYFIISKPIIRYDTLRSEKHLHPQIVSDTSRVIYQKLLVSVGFQVKPRQILLQDQLVLKDIKVQVPKCHNAILLMSVSSSASMMLLIDTLGIVEEFYILDTSGNGLWDEIAEKTIRSIQYKPILLDGKPVKSWLIIPIGNYVEILRETEETEMKQSTETDN